MPAPVSITAPNSPKKRGGKTSYGGSRPSPSGGHTAPARTTPTVTTVSPSGAVVSSGPSSAAATARARASQARVRRIQHAVAMTHKRPSKPITAKLPSPTSKPKTFLGKRTVGTPTLVSLQKSLKKGNLMLTANQKAWTTPQVRKVTQALQQAAPKPIPGLDPSQQAVVRTVLQQGAKAGATKKEKLAAIETGVVESHLQNLKYGDADSQGWRQERTSIYGTGPTGPTNVKASAKRFFQESVSDTGGTRGAGMTAGELAQTIQGSAFPARYDAVKSQALPILRAADGKKIPPKVVARAKSLGLLGPGAQVATGAKAHNPYAFFLPKGAGFKPNSSMDGRTDMGWDLEPGRNLPVLAMGKAQVTAVAPASGYGYIISYRLLDGPKKGREVFLGHSQPLPSLKVGQVLKKGQQYATSAGLDTSIPGHLEIGWAAPGGASTLSSYHGTSGIKDDEGSGNKTVQGDEGTPEGRSFRTFALKVFAHAPLSKGSFRNIPGLSPIPTSTFGTGYATPASTYLGGATGTSPTGTSPQSTKPTGAEILAKLKKYGVGTAAPTTSTSSATLAELEKRYGAPTV